MPEAARWTEKYRPQNLGTILGNNKAISELRGWAMLWEKKAPFPKGAILYGPAGTGKTSAALALAHEFDWDCIEMNASDVRTASMIQHIAGPASRSSSFSGQKRLIILDEADNLHGTADRGGASAMLRLVKETSQPILLIANEYYEIEKQLRDATKGIAFRSIRSTTIAATLRDICKKEGLSCDSNVLELISERAGGDLRSAINDLQAAAQGQNELSLDDVVTAERDIRESIFRVLEVIFKGCKAKEALEASYDLDESPEDFIHWVDENLPVAYEGDDLARGYENLSRADMFLGRVKRRQSYGLWRFATFLMTGGVQAAKTKQRHCYLAFHPPGIWRRMGQTRKARNIRDSAAKKIAQKCHVSKRFALLEILDFIGLLLRDKELASKVAAELNLDSEEIALLIESSPSTKKVQAVFGEAQRLLEAERVEEIELAWHKFPQDTVHSISKEVDDKDLVSEPLEIRPEEDEKVQTETEPNIRAESGKASSPKKQRSLFDF
jgi:replication factor C large subunit